MEQKIKQKLREIERTENVRIIYACEADWAKLNALFLEVVKC